MTDSASSPTVHVVIVTFNSANDIGQCLRAIESTTDAEYAITVVDNGSLDATLDIIARHHPRTNVLRNDRNVGFAAAVNRGALEATAPWLLLINPDLIVHPGCIDRLLASAEQRPESGLYTGQTFDPAGHSDTMSIWGFPSLWSSACFALGLDHFFRRSPFFDPESLGHGRQKPREVPAVSGALCLIRRDLWDRAGGYDERYLLYGEDLDFSRRARKLGASPFYEPDATATHHRGASSSSSAVRRVLVMLGKTTFVKTHQKPPVARAQIALMAVGTLLRSIRETRTGSTVTDYPWLLARQERATWMAGWGSSLEVDPARLDDIVQTLTSRAEMSRPRHGKDIGMRCLHRWQLGRRHEAATPTKRGRRTIARTRRGLRRSPAESPSLGLEPVARLVEGHANRPDHPLPSDDLDRRL